MTYSRDDLAVLLLDLISTEREVPPSRVTSLGGDDWDGMLSLAREHRLEPILHWRLTHERLELPVPGAARQRLALAYRGGTFRALLLQRELISARTVLHEAGIPCLALKGAYLAYHVYPEPALRPLRDLDLLVPPEAALEAYRALRAAGLSRAPEFAGDVGTWALVHKHLPPLRAASGQVSIEIHGSLEDPDPESGEAADETGLWDRRIEKDLAGRTVEYLSETDLLLHLITHGVYTHRLNNGPLVLADLWYLLRAGDIDWDLFWRRAEEGRRTRGCQLLLTMTELFFGALPVEVPDFVSAWPAETKALAPACASLMLRGWASVSDEHLIEALDGQPLSRRLRVLLGKVFPSRTHLATLYPCAPDSAAIFLCYAPNALRLATRRTSQVLRGRGRLAGDVRTLIELDRWLVQG